MKRPFRSSIVFKINYQTHWQLYGAAWRKGRAKVNKGVADELGSDIEE
jgi:hypothetical protein